MYEGSISSSRRPIAALEDYSEKNNKRAKDYYYRNRDELKIKMKERAHAKLGQLQERVKTVLAAVVDISLALLQIQDSLRAFEPPRLNTFIIIFVINQATMAISASTSASAPAPALTRVELVSKTQLQWLLTK